MIRYLISPSFTVMVNSHNSYRIAIADLARVPIDDINPLVSIAADYEITGGNWINNFAFSVPDGTNRAPIGIGGNPKGLAIASARNWLELEGPIGTSESDSNPLTPTFKWDFKGEYDPCGLPNLEPNKDIHEVNLYVSVFPEGEGLLPGDKWEGLNSTDKKDYNPNRILTAKWSKNTGNWTWNGGSKPGNFEEFTLPPSLMLTAGQKYHWAVEPLGENGKQLGKGQPVTGEFKTLLPAVKNSNTFSNVTVLTRGVEPGKPEHSQLIDGQINAVAKHIYKEGGAVQKYNSATGKWQSVIPKGNDWIFNNAVRPPQYGKPLVLLANWMDGIEPEQFYNSGFAEAAADTLFASMVQLDLNNGGGVGGSLGQLYDSTGKLIRNQGAVFNSPLHFVGFGQGAVVNSEIVQRLGTFFPNAGGTALENRDLQMTTIDPYNYGAESFEGYYNNILDPEIKVWNNVTYADNYYQTNGSGNTINGRKLAGKNSKSDWNVSLNDLAGFVPDDGAGASHREALAWYAGTANLTGSKLPSENGDTIYRRLGDLEQNNIADATKTWYTPDHTNASFTRGNEKAPWEGIGTGWFHSVLGGGSEVRPYVDGEKKSKNQLGNFEDYLKNNRVSVYEDNTYTDSTKPFGTRMRGDSAVPTLFNGNFDAIAAKLNSQSIPGWSLYNGENGVNKDVSQKYLIDVNRISQIENPGLHEHLEKQAADRSKPNYALKLGGADGLTEIVHNPFVVPDWGALRFDLGVPKSSLLQGGKLKFSIISSTDPSLKKEEKIFLEPSQNKLIEIGKDARGNKITIPGTYEADKYKIDYGVNGWESFYIDIPKELRGKPATIQFALETNNLIPTQVYVDNVFFKSDNVIFGNPTQAREEVNEQYKKNYIIEKPQYSLSYNSQKNTPNWVSWKLDRSWLGEFGSSYRPYGFAQDPDLDNSGWYQVNQSDYNYKFEFGDYFELNRGHLSASADRSRSLKDLYATNLTTNIVPQDAKVNQSSRLWLGLEDTLRNKVAEFGDSFYIIAGGRGTNKYLKEFPAQGDSNQKIHVPDRTWKVVLGFNPPNLRLPGYTLDTRYPDYVYAVDIPNSGIATQKKSWGDYRITIEELERRLNVEKNSNAFEYNFLSEITDTRI